MAYKITIKKRAMKALEKINEPYYSKIKTAIYNLADNPRPSGVINLTNRKGYRIRVGNYRVIYDIDDKISLVDVDDLGHRKDIYKK